MEMGSRVKREADEVIGTTQDRPPKKSRRAEKRMINHLTDD